ncbi:hypothetical protein Pmani_009233 [Petrolisthes manimaculis]|uniref:Uncharacterized protein n=1 Tax=Petrolisthes manimaculis TaxID=1843537 RepID=A0AAE1Q4P8_9EUCA|nr:hypothetical protein Pmani_009233 [Petrolisthes manimaculis]
MQNILPNSAKLMFNRKGGKSSHADFIIMTGPVRVFKDRNSLVGGVSPDLAVCTKSRPLAVVNETGAERVFKNVLVSLFRRSSVSVTDGELAIQSDLRQSVVLYHEDMACSV